MAECSLCYELNRYAELLYKRLTEEFYPARQLSFLAWPTNQLYYLPYSKGFLHFINRLPRRCSMNRDLKTQFINYMTLQRFALSTKKNYIAAFEGISTVSPAVSRNTDRRSDSGVPALPYRRPQTIMGDVQQLFFFFFQFLPECVQVGWDPFFHSPTAPH